MPGWHRGVPGRLLAHPVQVMAQPCAQMPGDATVMGAARPLSGLSLAESKAFYTSKLQNTTLGVVGFMHVCIFGYYPISRLMSLPPGIGKMLSPVPFLTQSLVLLLARKTTTTTTLYIM